MKTWMKVAVGCLALSILGVFATVAGLVGLGYWAKNSLEEMTGGGPEVEEARKAANAVPFTRPPEAVVDEPRLVKFIGVRARVFGVYEKYRGEIESRVARMKEGKAIEFSDISTGLTLMGELQKAETLALAKEGMSEDEYSFISGEVYKSMWTDFGGGEPGRKTLAEAANGARAATDALKPVDAPGLPREAREALERAGAEITQGTKTAVEEIEKFKTAPANLALFKKYEADLKKYAMPALSTLFEDEVGKAAKKKQGES